jgi:hypothetical protein
MKNQTFASGKTPAFTSGKKTSAEATEKTINSKLAKGGKDHMLKEQPASTARPGIAGKATKGPNKQFTEGGKTSTAYAPVKSAVAGHTSIPAQRAGSRNSTGSPPKSDQSYQPVRPRQDIDAAPPSIFDHSYKPQRTDYGKG